jgi:hypothetical protein
LFFGIFGSLIAEKIASWGVDKLEQKLKRDKSIKAACDAIGIDVNARSVPKVTARWVCAILSICSFPLCLLWFTTVQKLLFLDYFPPPLTNIVVLETIARTHPR